MPVRECMQRINSREFAEWQAYDAISPIGDRRGDLQAGTIAAHLGNVLCGKTHWKDEDFEIRYASEEERQRQSVEEMQAILRPVIAEAVAVAEAEKAQKGMA